MGKSCESVFELLLIDMGKSSEAVFCLSLQRDVDANLNRSHNDTTSIGKDKLIKAHLLSLVSIFKT